MKHAARLMLFVALLLPFRGALAVSAWLCDTDTSPTMPMAMHGHGPGAMPKADMNQEVDHGGCHGAGDQGDQAGPHNPACNFCSSICGAPAFPSAHVQFRGLLSSGGERFAAIAPPRAEFALGGLERPPRTI